MIFFLTQLVLATVPNPARTPGVVRPLTVQQICATRWGVDRRHVSVAMKKQVAVWYGLPWAERHRVEFDHLVPRSLAGADDVRNLFPQAWPAAREKDRLEVRLGRLVCAGQLSLTEAQAAIRTDWRAAARRYAKPPR